MVTPIRERGATIDSSWRPVDTKSCVSGPTDASRRKPGWLKRRSL